MASMELKKFSQTTFWEIVEHARLAYVLCRGLQPPGIMANVTTPLSLPSNWASACVQAASESEEAITHWTQCWRGSCVPGALRPCPMSTWNHTGLVLLLVMEGSVTASHALHPITAPFSLLHKPLSGFVTKSPPNHKCVTSLSPAQSIGP